MSNRPPLTNVLKLPAKPALMEIGVAFLRLGLMGFGGPLALVMLMESEFVRKKGWMRTAEFSDRFIVCKLLPGPVAFQMALWIGYHVRGVRGGVVAALCFLAPGALMVLALAITYEGIAEIPGGGSLIAGMRIGALVVIWDSAVKLFEPYYRRFLAWVFLVVGFVMMGLAPGFEPFIILFGGAASVTVSHRFRIQLSPWLLLLLFWVHFKAGAFTFGTGLAIIPVLQHQAVDVYQWLLKPEFLDAVAFGQITPGPVTLTATFIGYRAAGILGALAATVGMYLPGCLIILIIMPYLFPRLERSTWLREFCDGAVPVVIGCIFAASLSLVSAAFVDKREMILGVTLLVLNIHFCLSGWKIIALSSILYRGLVYL